MHLLLTTDAIVCYCIRIHMFSTDYRVSNSHFRLDCSIQSLCTCCRVKGRQNLILVKWNWSTRPRQTAQDIQVLLNRRPARYVCLYFHDISKRTTAVKFMVSVASTTANGKGNGYGLWKTEVQSTWVVRRSSQHKDVVLPVQKITL